MSDRKLTPIYSLAVAWPRCISTEVFAGNLTLCVPRWLARPRLIVVSCCAGNVGCRHRRLMGLVAGYRHWRQNV